MPVKKTKQQLIIVTALVLLALVAAPGFSWAQGYVEPGAGGRGTPPQSTPSGGPALEFLNGSTAEQRKLGSLVIGERDLNTAVLPTSRVPNCTDTDTSGCSRLCLNGNPANGANDPDCIRDWSDLVLFVGGPFLHLLSAGQVSQVDPGFVSLRSSAYNQQLISLIGEANPAVNGSIGIRADSTSTSHYAGQFSGRVVIQRTASTASLCLHGSCVVSWATTIPAPSDAVALQNDNGYLRQQSGNVSLTGLVVAGSIVSGVPTAATDPTVTCGDGLCSTENSEDSTNCSADCL